MSVQVLAPTRREAVEQRRRRISRVVLAAHIADAVGLLGADLALVVLGISALSGGDPLAAYPAMSLISRAVLLPLAALTLVSGIALALLSRWGLARYWWTTIKLAVTVGLITVLGLVLVPGLGRAAAAASGGTGTAIPVARQLAYVVAPATASLLLITNLVLGVYKPFGRLRAAGDRPSPDEARAAAARVHAREVA